jgi:hypothetical protein
MLNLIQLYNRVDDKDLFIKLFSDFNQDCIEFGYEDDKSELFNEMLYNHFGLELVNDNQLNRVVNSLVNMQSLELLRSL